MARYRKIDTRTWNDKKFNELSDHGKLVFFLLLTHPHLTSIGAMRSSLASLADDLHWPVEKLEKAFFESLSKNMVRYDNNASLIWLPNFLKYNQPESPNVVRSWEGSLDYLPECPLKTTVINHIENFVLTRTHSFREAFAKAFGKGMPNQEQEQEHKQEHNKIQCRVSDKKKNPEVENQAHQILNFLNEKTGKKFRPTDTNLRLIIARLKTGSTVTECKQVIAMKHREWKNNPEFFKYLRPKTLFRPSNFESYIGELVLPKDDEQ